MIRVRKRVGKAKWSSALTQLPALAVRQPWAWLIVNGYKDVENRSWFTRHRGPLLVHAATSKANLDESFLRAVERRHRIKLPRDYELGGVVGIVEVVDCKTRTRSPWHVRGQVGWILDKPRRLSFRRCKGALNLFRPKFARTGA